MEYANHSSLKCQDSLTYAKTDDTNLDCSFNNPDSICIDTLLSEVLFNHATDEDDIDAENEFHVSSENLEEGGGGGGGRQCLKKIIKIMPKNQEMNLFIMVVQCQRSPLSFVLHYAWDFRKSITRSNNSRSYCSALYRSTSWTEKPVSF